MATAALWVASGWLPPAARAVARDPDCPRPQRRGMRCRRVSLYEDTVGHAIEQLWPAIRSLGEAVGALCMSSFYSLSASVVASAKVLRKMAGLMDREMVRSRSRDKKGAVGGMRGWSDSDSDDGKYQLKAPTKLAPVSGWKQAENKKPAGSQDIFLRSTPVISGIRLLPAPGLDDEEEGSDGEKIRKPVASRGKPLKAASADDLAHVRGPRKDAETSERKADQEDLGLHGPAFSMLMRMFKLQRCQEETVRRTRLQRQTEIGKARRPRRGVKKTRVKAEAKRRRTGMEQTEAEETMAALGEETRIAIGNGKTTAKRTEIAERSLVTIAVIAEMITKMIAMRGETKIAVTDVKSTTDTIDGRGATGIVVAQIGVIGTETGIEAAIGASEPALCGSAGSQLAQRDCQSISASKLSPRTFELRLRQSARLLQDLQQLSAVSPNLASRVDGVGWSATHESRAPKLSFAEDMQSQCGNCCSRPGCGAVQHKNLKVSSRTLTAPQHSIPQELLFCLVSNIAQKTRGIIHKTLHQLVTRFVFDDSLVLPATLEDGVAVSFQTDLALLPEQPQRASRHTCRRDFELSCASKRLLCSQNPESQQMGVTCSTFVQDKVEDVEPCSIKSAGVGLESEPLWKQMAQAHIESQKAAEAARPQVQKLLAERAAARQAAIKQAEAERKAAEAKLKELERLQRQKEEDDAATKKEKEETQKAAKQLPSSKAKPKTKTQGASSKPAAPSQPAKLTKDQAKDALNRAVAIFDMPENRRKLQEAASSCDGDDAKKMAVLMPLVQGMLKDLLESHGFTGERILHAVMQISTHAQGDKRMSKQLAKLQATLEGNV
eukprot:s2470_g2.t2